MKYLRLGFSVNDKTVVEGKIKEKKPSSEGVKKSKNILLSPKRDRRLLAHVPDPETIRTNEDRRAKANFRNNSRFAQFAGQRYESDFEVVLEASGLSKRKLRLQGTCIDISQSGMQLRFSEKDFTKLQELAQPLSEAFFTLKFRIPAGTLSEGMEKRVEIRATMVRFDEVMRGIGVQFSEHLFLHLHRRSDRYMLSMAALMLFCVVAIVLLLRYESFLYLRFATTLSVYSIITAVFLLSRYLFGALYKATPIDPTFTPGVTIVIPCFNEEEWIERTIISCVDQDYPVDQLDVIVVDDCSTDRSYQIIQDTIARLHKESERFQTQKRVTCVRQEQNKGKREALAVGVRRSTKEFVTFVDSDSFLEPDAIRNLVQPFYDPDVHGVSGRTDVANTFTNGLTKMQAVRYYIAFRMMKAAESYFDSVLCLSGPLSCYRRQTVLAYLDQWLNQKFLGQKATFGDDRALTHMVLRKYRTVYQDTAICSTIVPHKMGVILKQQMRWKRSWLRESLIATMFMWRKEPFMALLFYMGLVIPVLAPIIVIYNLVYIPIVVRIFPSTFLMGLLCMAMLMSFAQLLLRKSSLWLYGLWYCLFYEAVLLWQMPWAWVTFWVSTWGTRMTPADIAAREKRKLKLQGRQEKADV